MTVTRATVALVRDLESPLELTEVQIPTLESGEVLVRLRGTGVCHTDLVALEGGIPLETPFVLGHEGAGVVAAIADDVTALSVGDAVVLSFDHCTECAQCTSGHPAYCELSGAMNYFGSRLDGSTTLSENGEEVHGSWFGQSSFGTYAVASVRNAVRVDADLPLDILGPLGCGLLTGAGTVLNVLRPEPGQSLIVFGVGGVGLAAIMAARVAGCDPIIAVDLNPERLELARELGATHVVNSGETTDLGWALTEITGTGADFAIETVGLGPVVRTAVESLKTPGRAVTLGARSMENEITIDQGNLLMGRQLLGVLEGDADPHELIPRLIELWRAGQFPFDRLVEKFPFERITDAVAAVRDGKVIKPVLTFGES
ncbi:NAD(P)-dependent alcohol dehydrogenase [Nocardia inohanensis]|uniref:NAD(P)-dependent alcohol dehydrogenase n=1 Tax=Nocardia inohanensis TaxID=209246 RepID=UPI0008338718|nr:NAD(P)-dependent alcohol dehydrogenase [Nocardia inohanensis]